MISFGVGGALRMGVAKLFYILNVFKIKITFMKYFRFWLRKGQVRQFLWILGGAWRPLLLLEYKKNEMD